MSSTSNSFANFNLNGPMQPQPMFKEEPDSNMQQQMHLSNQMQPVYHLQAQQQQRNYHSNSIPFSAGNTGHQNISFAGGGLNQISNGIPHQVVQPGTSLPAVGNGNNARSPALLGHDQQQQSSINGAYPTRPSSGQGMMMGRPSSGSGQLQRPLSNSSNHHSGAPSPMMPASPANAHVQQHQHVISANVAPIPYPVMSCAASTSVVLTCSTTWSGSSINQQQLQTIQSGQGQLIRLPSGAVANMHNPNYRSSGGIMGGGNVPISQTQQQGQQVFVVSSQGGLRPMMGNMSSGQQHPSSMQQQGGGTSIQILQPQQQQPTRYLAAKPSFPSNATGSGQRLPTIIATAPMHHPSQQQQQQQQPPITAAGQLPNAAMQPEQAKKKCRNFLQTLLKLAADPKQQENPHTFTRVRGLVQNLVNGRITPQNFTKELQDVLNSAPQPPLVPFLEQSLPSLRHAMVTGELTIDGISAPYTIAQLQEQQPQQSQHQVRIVPLMSGGGSSYQQPQPQGYQQQPHQTTSGQVVFNAGPSMYPSTQQRSLVSPGTIRPRLPNIVSSSRLVPPILPQRPGSSTAAAPATPDRYRDAAADDDINDVAAMGGVNLHEESQQILAQTNELLSQETRSLANDAQLLPCARLQDVILRMVNSRGLSLSPQVVSLISTAAEERLKDLMEKLSVITEHRLEMLRINPFYEQTTDTRSQIKFLEEVDKVRQKRHEELEKERLMRMAKSRGKAEDPEQQELKMKAKEMQKQEQDEAQNRNANVAAQLALQTRKRPRTDTDSNSGMFGTNSIVGPTNSFVNPLLRSEQSIANTQGSLRTQVAKPRIKRVSMKDLALLIQQESDLRSSAVAFKLYHRTL